MYKKKIKKLQTGGDPPTRVRPFAPYNNNVVPLYTPEVGYDAPFTPEAPSNPTDVDALTWTQAYVNSPKYKERLAKSFKYPDYIQRQRASKLSNVGFSEGEEANTSYSDTDSYPNQVRLGLKQLRNEGISRTEATVHELGHVTNANKRNPALRLTAAEERFIFDRNKTLTPEQRASIQRGSEGSTLSEYLGKGSTHDIAPSETMSDVQALRYFMNKNKIYDARTQDITPEILNRALQNPEIKKQFSTKRLLENFDQNSLTEILNRIALNDSQPATNTMTAKYGKYIPKYEGGGLSRDKDYSSKKKPYPSVSKEDFAGKGRSYPIPTKADAVDALRLAGLHGRSDVKAKVYKKYPELKKSKWGTKVMQGGGPIDPLDPEFAMKMQELLRTNPELAQDIFEPATSATPPGVDASQQLTDLQPTDAQQLAWNNPQMPEEQVASPDTNTDSQQRNNSWKSKTVNIPVGDAIQGLVFGANALATEYIEKPRRRANEMRLLRRQLAPVISKPSQGGYDMPVLAKSGIKITSAYTNLAIPRDSSAPKRPWGNKAEQYKTDNPEVANVLVEGGEFLELPDGQTSMINGDSHSDYSGGELMRLPEGSKVYSDSIKVDPTFAKDLTGSKFKKKKTVAQLAKKYDTEHEEGILKDPTSDNISKRSANIMKTFKQGQLQQLFDYQEATKDPLYLVGKDTMAQDFIGTEDEVVARKGVKVMQDGGKNGDKKKNPLAPNRQPMYTIQNGFPVQVLPQVEITAKRKPRTGFDPMTGRYISNIQPAETQRVTSVTPPVSTPVSTPDSTPEWTSMDLEPIRGKYVLDTLPQGVQPPQLQPLVAQTTIQPGDTPIDPNKPNKSIPDNNKANPPQPTPKVPWGDTLGGFGEIVPELFGMIQNQSDFPIFTAKYQPKYLNPVELNIQASLNRNYSQTQPLLQSTGNPSIDNARAAQAIANLYDANNQMFEQKFNFDTQNRYQTDATNLEIENQANLLNLQRADQFWDKVTARQAVKEATNNNIINSAYSKFKRKQLEKRSLQLTNQMFDNFRYDPNRGIYFDNNGQEFVFHEPSGNFINIGTGVGDGVKTTRTTRTDNKEKTTQTVKQEERRGS